MQFRDNKGTTLREWTSFLTVLHGNKNSGEPLFRKSAAPGKIMDHLEKEFTTENTVFSDRWYTVTKVKRKKIIPGQLTIWQ